MSAWRPSRRNASMSRRAAPAAATGAFHSSGTSPPLLRTARLQARHSMSRPRASATSLSQREARQVQGQAGSKENITSAITDPFCGWRTSARFEAAAAQQPDGPPAELLALHGGEDSEVVARRPRAAAVIEQAGGDPALGAAAAAVDHRVGFDPSHAARVFSQGPGWVRTGADDRRPEAGRVRRRGEQPESMLREVGPGGRAKPDRAGIPPEHFYHRGDRV